MKKFNAAVFSLVVAVPFFSVAHPLESVLKNLGVVAPQMGNKVLQREGDAEPIRYAKVRVRVIKHTSNNDPDSPGFDETDVCILQSDRLPVYDLRKGNSGGGLLLQCVDSETRQTLWVISGVGVANAKIIDGTDDVKFASTVLAAGPGRERVPTAGANLATKDLGLRSMILIAKPVLESECVDKGDRIVCSPSNRMYYSAMFEIED